jgi:BirA family transcriptional regulator, biotin operon repressor / biotin---[acetyl-CoA-carboxylase] ligase
MYPSRHRIVSLTETESTNADALRFALAGEALPLWVAAERQSAGRGRTGRTWSSGAGNLQASLAIACDAPLHTAGQLSLLAGIALIDALRAVSPLAPAIGLRLKWPNDLLIQGAKAGGILVETTTARGAPGYIAVIGFGVNVASCPQDLGRAVTSLAGCGIVTTPADVLDALADQCDAWLKIWDSGRNFGDVRNAWTERAGPVGEAITVNTSIGVVPATYRGIDASGALLAEVDGRLQTITFGDVDLIAPTEKSGGQ